MVLTYVVAWIPMVLIGIANGAIRELTYGKALTELAAHQISAVTGVILFVSYTWLLSLRWPVHSAGQALAVGVIWLGLTVAFESLFGHYVMRHSWRDLLHDYNLLAGRVWSLVLVAITLAPLLIYQFTRRR